MADDEEGKAPAGSRIGRTFKLAKLATSTSAQLAKGMARRAVGAEPGERMDTHRGIATSVADALGSMKGLAMKAGQILSYVDDWIPEDVRPAYRDVLGNVASKEFFQDIYLWHEERRERFWTTGLKACDCRFSRRRSIWPNVTAPSICSRRLHKSKRFVRARSCRRW